MRKSEYQFLGKSVKHAVVEELHLENAIREAVVWIDGAVSLSDGDMAARDVEMLKALLKKTIGE